MPAEDRDFPACSFSPVFRAIAGTAAIIERNVIVYIDREYMAQGALPHGKRPPFLLSWKHGRKKNATKKKGRTMFNALMVIGIILLVLWLLGLVSSFTMGGFIYVALIIGLVLLVISLVPRFRRRG